MSSASHVPNFNDKVRYVNLKYLSKLQLSVELRQLRVMIQT